MSMNEIMIAPVPASEEDKYSILGYLIMYSVPEMSISPSDLKQLFIDNGVSEQFLPPKITGIDAFRRAATSASENLKDTGYKLRDGESLITLMRNVKNTEAVVIKRVVMERRNSEDKRLEYLQLADVTFTASTNDFEIELLDKTFKKDSEEIIMLRDKALTTIRDNFEDFKIYLKGSHIRTMIRKALGTTEPINMRPNPGTGGVWFVAHSDKILVKSLQKLVGQFDKYRTTSKGMTCFDVIPMLDLEEQRDMISSRFENQVDEEVAKTVLEIQALLESDKKFKMETVDNYINRIGELQEGINKYESLLNQEMGASKEKANILMLQVNELLRKVSK
jgi:hypothetical protein